MFFFVQTLIAPCIGSGVLLNSACGLDPHEKSIEKVVCSNVNRSMCCNEVVVKFCTCSGTKVSRIMKCGVFKRQITLCSGNSLVDDPLNSSRHTEPM